MTRSHTLLRILPLTVVVFSCQEAAPPAEIDTTGYTTADTTRTADRLPPPITFTDVTAEAGIDFVHETGAFGQKWMPESMGSGCVLFDYDGDESLDILLINGTWWPGHEGAGRPTSRLYRNLGDGGFEDVTEVTGLDLLIYATGGAAGDFDGDGDLDLFLSSVGSNLLLRNDKGRFIDVSEKAGVAGRDWLSEAGKANGEWSMGAAWVDVDQDGWIDLFVTNYVRWSPETDLFTTLDGTTKSYATPEQYEGSTCRLYHNRGNGTFEDVTVTSGVSNPRGKSLSVAVADFNLDGYPDLVVSNDTQPNFLYMNRGDGTFEDIALAAGVAFDEAGRARAGMGMDIASMDNDSSLTIAIGNFSRESVSLYRQAWEDVFVDVAGGRGISRPTLFPLTFGVKFADCDLDGLLDLVLANGHLDPQIQNVRKEIPYRQRPQLFWNDGAGGFIEISEQAGGPFIEPVVGRGLAAGDLDGDGDLDFVLTAAGERPVVMRNEGPVGNGIRVRLEGDPPNSHALGAVVTATVGGIRQRRQVQTGSSYLSQSELTVTFGLGAEPSADIHILWPGGSEEAVGTLRARATYRIRKGLGVVDETPFIASSNQGGRGKAIED